MSWTPEDSDALFRGSSEAPDEQASAPNDSQEAMRRLRFPFEADPADAFEQQLTVPVDEDEYRR